MSDHESLDGDAGLPLTFDAWADLSARLLNLGPQARLDILDGEDLDEQDWMRCDDHYCVALAKDIAQDRMDRAESYAGKCVAELDRRRTHVGAEIAADAAPPEVPSEPEATMTVGAPLQMAPPSTPSFLLPQQAPAVPLDAPRRPRHELAATTDAFELPTALKGGALPFNTSTLPSPLAGASATKLPTPIRAGAETLPMDPDLPLGPALPFGPSEPTPAGPTGMTLLLGTPRRMVTGGAEPPNASAFSPMPLQTYASFCAEMNTFPDKAAEVQKRYSVRSDAARTALDQDWQAQFDAHPELKAEWERLVAHYREWLQRQPRA